MKRITIDIPDALHKELKIHIAYFNKINMKNFITNLIEKEIGLERTFNKEGEYYQSKVRNKNN
jgi:hypothetical protein